MPPELLSFLEKIPNTDVFLPMEWQGKNIDKKYSELQTRLADLSINKLLPLAVLLQHIDISIFTDEELLAVASLSIEGIVTKPITPPHNKFFSSSTPLFDSKTVRVLNFLDYDFLSSFMMKDLFSNFIIYTPKLFKELIVNIYNNV